MKTLPEVLAVFKKDGITLSDQQAAVVNWVITGKGSCIMLARAGCGKTFSLVTVVRTIIGCNLGDIVAMAFNKPIADELGSKFKQLGIDWKQAQAATCHSLGFSAWRKVAPNVKVVKKNSEKLWVIVDQCALDYEGAIFKAQGEAIVKLVSYAKQRAVGHLCSVDNIKEWEDIYEHFNIEDIVTENMEPSSIIKAAIRVYNISLKQCYDYIDYDDMILAPLYFKARFWPKKWVLVDEYQDTNPARRALAMAMLDPRVGRMLVVGDDFQSIYGFTGADADAFEQMKKATNAITLPLNVTRRCPKAVVAQAKAFVPDFTAHESAPEGVVRTAAYEAIFTDKLSKDDVILCRNTAPLIKTAYALLSKGIACKVEGRDIGKGLITLARKWKVVQLSALQNKLDDYQAKQSAKFMSKGQEEKIDKLVDQIECLRIIINRCLLDKRTTIDDLVVEVTTMFGDTKDGEMPNVLTLATVHRSKGREWKRVYILGRRQFMPSPYAKKPWQMQQEIHLEYVAITRSMHELIDIPMPEGDKGK